MTWNLDIASAPRDRQILMRTTRDGSKVFVTNWLEPTKHTQNGRFNGFPENAKTLLAWCEIPEFAAASQGEAGALSAERVSPGYEGSAAASIGGGHVAEGGNAQPVSAGEFVSRSPAFIIDDCGSGA